MSTIERMPIYLQLGLVKTIIGSESHYSSTPEGDLDVDRLIRSQPAFQSHDDSLRYKTKKLVLNRLAPLLYDYELDFWIKNDSRDIRLSILIMLRQLLVDGFELYQYQDGQCIKLTPFTLSQLFLNAVSQAPDEAVHQAAIEQIGISYDCVVVLSQNHIDKITDSLAKLPQSLWLSDAYYAYEKDPYLFNIAFMDSKKTWWPTISNVVVNYWSTKDYLDLTSINAHFNDKRVERIVHCYDINRLINRQDIDDSRLEKIVLDTGYWEYIELDGKKVSSLLESSLYLRELTIRYTSFLNNPLFMTVNMEQLESMELNRLKITQSSMVSLLQHAPQLKHLNMQNVECPIETVSSFPVLDNLLSLTLSAELPSPSTISAFIKKMPHLKKLHLIINTNYDNKSSNKNDFDERYWSNEFLELEELDLSGSEVTCKQLKVLLKTMPHLKKLNLKGCRELNLNDSGLTVELRELEELNLNESMVDGKLLAELLRKSSNLKRLDLTKCTTLHERACLFHSDLSSLEEIKLDGSTIQNKQLASILENAVQLKVLDLHQCSMSIELKDEKGNIKIKCSQDGTPFQTMNLASLVIFKPGSILNKDQFVAVIMSAPKLIELEKFERQGHSLDSEQEINSLILKGRLLHLQKFTIKLEEKNELKFYITHMPQLKILRLVDFFSNQKGLSLDAPLNTVEELILGSGASRGSSIKAQQLVQSLQTAFNLKKLDLSWCSQLIDDAGDFRVPLVNLESLVLLGSTVTDRFLLSLLNNAPNLSNLQAKKCKIVSTKKQFTDKLKDLLAQFKVTPPEGFPYQGEGPSYCLPSDLPVEEQYKIRSTFPPEMSHGERFSGQDQRQGAPTHQQTMSSNQTQSLDADTTDKKQTYQLKQIFQSRTHGEGSPEVAQYRLSSFNHYQENNHHCSQQHAFSLDNEGDLQLIDTSFEDLNSLSAGIQRTDKKCYYGKTQLQLSQEWQALPSLSPSETLTHLHASIENVNIEVKYSKRDNLYYIHQKMGSSSWVDLDFIVEDAGNLSLEKIPDVLQPLFDYCRNFKNQPLVISVKNPNGRDYLETLVSQATGSCRHRSLVFKALLDNASLRKKLPLPLQSQLQSLKSYPVRIINNDCHSFVEIKLNSQWVRADLGGYDAQLTVDETAFKAFENTSEPSELIEDACLKFIDETVEKDYFPEIALFENKLSLDAYLQQSCQPTADKLLILSDSNQAAALSYHLQSYCQRTSKDNSFGKAVYYVHEPEDLMCQLPYAEIKDSPEGLLKGELKEGPGGSMYRFLTQPDFQGQRIIVVNFNHFPANKLASFNSLLDESPNIDGIPLPLGMKVIGLLDPQKPQDASFYSRFEGHYSHCPISSRDLEVPEIFQDVESGPAVKPEEVERIDLHGSPFWRSALLGHWTLEGQALTYNNGPLIEALSKKPVPRKIMLTNAPLLDERFQQFWQQAQLKGYIDYENRRIDFPKDIQLCHQSGYQLESDYIADVSYQPCSKPLQVLNSHLLSGFLKKYEYHDAERSIYQIDGLLKQHQERTSDPFEVYLSETMTTTNWSLLLATCATLNVKLSITVAPGATLPEPLCTMYPSLLRYTLNEEREATQALLSSDRDVSVKQFQQAYPAALCIDVTELEASDLLTKLDGQFDSKNLQFSFEQQQGALLTALDAGKTVILHGTLSDEIRHRLAAVFMTRRYLTPEEIKGRLILVSEDESIKQLTGLVCVSQHDVTAQEKQTQLLRHAQSLIDDKLDITLARLKLNTIDNKKTLTEQQAIVRNRLIHLAEEVIDDKAPWFGMERTTAKPIQIEPFVIKKALAQADALDEQRLKQVQQKLKYSPFVFLAGISGTGKTTFVENVWQNAAARRKLYIAEQDNKQHFLKTLKAWATDDSPGEKALFIDEANITQNQWSLFEGLMNQPAGIMIGHRYFCPLSKDHKVIFAGNPTCYSDERQLPSLFKRHGNSVLFDPLTPAYIWQRMLRGVFESENQPNKVEAICQPILAMNQHVNALSTTETLLSPRELVMMAQLSLLYCKTHAAANPSQVAAYYAYSLARTFIPKVQLEAFDAQFKVSRPQASRDLLLKDAELTITESNREPAEMLNDFLMLRAQQIETARAHKPVVASGLGLRNPLIFKGTKKDFSNMIGLLKVY